MRDKKMYVDPEIKCILGTGQEEMIEGFVNNLNKKVVYTMPDFDLMTDIDKDAFLTGIISKVADAVDIKLNPALDANIAINDIRNKHGIIAGALITALAEVLVFDKSKYQQLAVSILNTKLELLFGNFSIGRLMIRGIANRINRPLTDFDKWDALYYKGYNI